MVHRGFVCGLDYGQHTIYQVTAVGFVPARGASDLDHWLGVRCLFGRRRLHVVLSRSESPGRVLLGHGVRAVCQRDFVFPTVHCIRVDWNGLGCDHRTCLQERLFGVDVQASQWNTIFSHVGASTSGHHVFVGNDLVLKRS